MKKRRILTAVLAVALAAGLWKVPASAVYQVNWDPQPADWAKEQMEDLADAGILAQGTYNPTAVMTRGRFCYFMVHLVLRTSPARTASAGGTMCTRRPAMVLPKAL